MQTPKFTFPIFPILLGCALAGGHSGLQAAALRQPGLPLESATVTELKNKVTLLDRNGKVLGPATVNDILKSEFVVTGKDSHAELVFKDHSVVRLGANTVFIFDPGSRNMVLIKGTSLVHVPTGLGGVTVHTPETSIYGPGSTFGIGLAEVDGSLPGESSSIRSLSPTSSSSPVAKNPISSTTTSSSTTPPTSNPGSQNGTHSIPSNSVDDTAAPGSLIPRPLYGDEITPSRTTPPTSSSGNQSTAPGALGTASRRSTLSDVLRGRLGLNWSDIPVLEGSHIDEGHIDNTFSTSSTTTSGGTTVTGTSSGSTGTGSTTVAVLSTKDSTTGQDVTVTNNKTGITTTVGSGQLHTESSTGQSTTTTVSVSTLVITGGLFNGFKNKLSSSAQNEITSTVTTQIKSIKNGTLIVLKGNQGNSPIAYGPEISINVPSQPTVLQDQVSFAAAAAKNTTTTTPFAGTYVGPTALFNIVNLTILPNSAFTFSATGGIPGGQGSFTGNISSNGSIAVGIAGAANSISAPPPSGSPSTYNGFYNGATPGPPIPFTAAKQ